MFARLVPNFFDVNCQNSKTTQVFLFRTNSIKGQACFAANPDYIYLQFSLERIRYYESYDPVRKVPYVKRVENKKY